MSHVAASYIAKLSSWLLVENLNLDPLTVAVFCCCAISFSFLQTWILNSMCLPNTSALLWGKRVWFAIIVPVLNPFSLWVFVNNFMELKIGIMNHKNAILFSVYILWSRKNQNNVYKRTPWEKLYWFYLAYPCFFIFNLSTFSTRHEFFLF